MYIDTHCHLTYDLSALGGLDAVLNRAYAADVDTLICATADPNDIASAISITEKYAQIYATIGIHPDHAGLINAADFISDKILQNPRVVGVGEIGLDYHVEEAPDHASQIALFEEQIELALRHNLPVAIHTRDAEEDTLAVLSNFKDVRGVMHCYTGSYDFATKLLERGFMFSASGILTFRNANDIRETFAKIPTGQIVIETDAPYCSPVPYRGKMCEPAFVVSTACTLAQIKNMDINELAPILRQNVKKLYPKMSLGTQTEQE